MIYTIQALAKPGHIDELMDNGLDNGTMDLKLSNGNVIKIGTRLAMLNTILLHPLIKLGIPINEKDIHYITAIKSNTISRIQTEQYRMLLDVADVHHMEIVALFWEAINNLYIWTKEHLGAYQQSMSILSLAKVQCHPAVKELTEYHIDPKLGTSYAEGKHKELTGKLIDAIGTRGVIDDNVLINFMETGSLKANQIPQQMLGYGTRSDIDDSMMSHVINESATSGLKSAADYGIESLSAKKSSYFNKHVIKDTQYFARVLRLNSSPIIKMYKGHCGSDVTIPLTIPKENTHNFVDKVCFHEGERKVITVANHSEFGDKRISLISPLGCRHLDGVCEYCAGRNTTKPWEWLPNVSNLGIFAGTKVGKAVSQKILSSKHLIKTNSLTYVLHDHAKNFLVTKSKHIHFRSNLTGLDKSTLRISADSLRHLNDLTHGKVEAEQFSDIKTFELIDAHKNVVELRLDVDRFIPYFSKQMLKHIKKNLSSIDIEDEYYNIPLKGFDIKNPVCSYTVINDDMIAFTREFTTMLTTRIREYTSLTTIMQDLTAILYSKTAINIFFVEVLMKSFIRSHNDEECGPAIVTDPDNVKLAGMSTNIESSSVSGKLGHEHLGTTKYLCDASTSVREKGPGVFDRFFNF